MVLRRSKFFWTFTSILILLVAARLALPYVLLDYVQKQINKLPDYHVKIADLDVHLYRGSYTIKGIQLWKVTNKIPVPFFSAKAIDFSLQWRALLHGSVVAKVLADEPSVNFVIDPKGQNQQLTIDKQWQDIVKSLYPLNVNRVEFVNGHMALRSFSGAPPFNLYMKNIHFLMQNMQNVDRNDKLLLSNFEGSAQTMDGADAKLQGRFDPFSKQPTFYLTASINGMQINKANKFLEHFTHVDVANGLFSLYIETAAADGKITGYAKPFIKNLQVINPKKKMGPVEALYKGALEVVGKILRDSKTKTIATKINISGDIDNPDKSILSIIGFTLRHAFIQALIPQVDHNVQMQDVIVGKRIAQIKEMNRAKTIEKKS